MKKGLSGFLSFCLAVLFTLSNVKGHAQQWTAAFPFGTNTAFVDAATAIATDATGNVYITGKFGGTINFGTGVLSATPGGTQTEGFVAKFNSAGTCQWAMRFGGPGTDLGGFAITTDGTNVYVTGGSAFPCTVGATPIVVAGASSDGVVFALNAATGAFVWGKAFGGPPAGDRGQALALDNVNGLYLMGVFFTRSTDAVTTASFGAPGSFSRSVQGNMAQSTSDLFVAKLDKLTGTFTWVSSGGAVSNAVPLHIGNDNINGGGLAYLPSLDELIVAGSFTNANAVYTTTVPASSVALTNTGMADIAILELNASTGAFLSGVTAGGANNDEALAVTFDPVAGAAFIAGYFNSANITGAMSLPNTAPGFDEIFYARYDPVSNSFPWAFPAKGSAGGDDVATGITQNGNGKIYITGRFKQTITFPSLSTVTATSAGADDIFLVRADAASGNAEIIADADGPTGADFSFGVAHSTGDDIWVGGSFFGGTLTFVPSSPTVSIASSGDDDIFIAKFNDPAIVTDPNVFYSKASGNLHDLGTWGINPDGTGTAPADFGPGKTFNLANRGTVYTMTGNWSVGGMIVNPTGSELQINGFILSEAGMSGSGTLTGSPTSSLVITGSAGGDAGTLAFTAGGQTLQDFMLNRTGSGASATLTTPLEIYNSVGANNGTFLTNGNLTLNSDAVNTARVLPLPAINSIQGNVTVERYIPARRAWRILTTPFLGGQTIFQSWQENRNNTMPDPNPFPGFGTHITGGPVFGSPANGFDQNPGAASSIKNYNSASDTWNPLPNTNVMNASGQALMIFIRGDRGIALGPNNVPPTPTTLRAKGPLKEGDQLVPVSVVGFTAVGNPFAAPIDFATIPKNNVQNTMWVWDPKLGGVNGAGGYVTVSSDGMGGWTITPAPVSPINTIIQSGQGFLVKAANAGNPSMVIRETDKSSAPTADVFRTSARTSQLRITLYGVDADQTTDVLDEVVSSYAPGFANGLDRFDVEKPSNIGENLAIVNGKTSLMVERRQKLMPEDGIRLKIWNLSERKYAFEINPQSMNAANVHAWLVDEYLKITTPVALDKSTRVDFTVTSNPASAASNRFRIVISEKMPDPDKWITGIRVYPNPVSGKNVTLEFHDQPEGKYEVTLYNNLGQMVWKKRINHDGQDGTQNMDLGKILLKGVYQMKVTNGNRMITLPLYTN